MQMIFVATVMVMQINSELNWLGSSYHGLLNLGADTTRPLDHIGWVRHSLSSLLLVLTI